MSCAEPSVVARLETLEPAMAAAAPLLAEAPFQGSEGWWRACAAAALPENTRPSFLLAQQAGAPRLLLPLRRDGRRLSGLVTPYTCLYAPVAAPEVSGGEMRQIGAACGKALHRWSRLRLDALDAESELLTSLLAGFGDAGWRHYRFAAFGNWHEDVSGLDWTGYLAARPGALRETIRRKLKRTFEFSVARTAAEAAPALPIYEMLHAKSWKQPEPFPHFNARLVAAAAAQGVLRFGVLRQQGAPVAAQYWVVERGSATVLKLAHDETARAQSPGTVLTALMLQALFAEGRLREIDFGRGDDPYKQDWVTARRQRIGVLLMNSRHPAGLGLLAARRVREGIRGLFVRHA